LSEIILTLNAGSSSLKFATYDAASLAPIVRGQVSGLGRSPRFKANRESGPTVVEDWPGVGLSEALERLLAWLATKEMGEVAAIGHRIVHGGLEFAEPVTLDASVLDRLSALSALAPLHQPFNLEGVETARRWRPDAVQVGVFDTAFHARQPILTRLYALPRTLRDEGVMAYGFHGLSYAFIAGVLASEHGEAAGGRAIVAHLGSGVSLCAMHSGASVASTMGFSALEGPPMGTRSGSLDPGVILYLLQAKGLDAAAISDLLYHRSGLLGLSGISGDMASLLASSEQAAQDAVAVFVDRVAREIGSLAAALEGLDTLVFTAGIGENSAAIRARIARRCGWLGVRRTAWSRS
jgi:acetate kinase